ncbi:MAG TPA: contractile injection system tape measure protein [Chitinophagaceae bacterium]|nr:contractile injection system tape measure protein [Chitinophagaceae bacterium]
MISPLNKGTAHIIQKQSISIAFENPENALGLQNRVAELFYERLQPRMEALFNEMADEDHIINIETLEIDCGIIGGKHWEDEWVDAVLFHLKQELNALPKKMVQPDQVNNQFFFFLETGQLPWNCSIRMITQLEELVVFDPIFFRRLEQIISDSAPARQRLINQFSEIFLKRLIDAYLKWEGKSIEAYTTNGTAFPFPSYTTRDMVVKVLTDSNQQKSLIKNETVNRVENPGAEKQSKTNQLKEIYINNAGLVILHPFLPALFEELQLIKDNHWVSEEAWQKAVLITGFLVTGEEEFPEFNLPLNKIICGIDLKSTLFSEISISAEVMAACEELLSQVIKHWSALKNTGIDSLRETFLKRNGKLTQVDNGWLLQVEQIGVDVLLNRLPWGMGIVKLPWMAEILHIEWI